MWIKILMILSFLCILAALILVVRRKNLDIIAANCIDTRKQRFDGLKHVFLCFVDHYEPYRDYSDDERAVNIVKEWVEYYPKSVDRFRDRGDRPPIHSFFYPEEEYNTECLDRLATLERSGFGSVEIHLHHDKDTSEGFRGKIESFKKKLHEQHGLLHKNPKTGLIEYAFIHGNWTLDDSGVNGKMCGVKDEITVLKETGCYADFTYPSAPHPTQPPVINKLYYATDDPLKEKSHHRGVEAEYNTKPGGDLLLITGPLTINWKNRKNGILPRIENGDITEVNPPTKERIDLWVRSGIGVKNWPGWIFIKIYTHGALPENTRLILSNKLGPMYEYLLTKYNDGMRYVTHFVSAHEMVHCVKALEEADDEKIRKIENFDYS